MSRNSPFVFATIVGRDSRGQTVLARQVEAKTLEVLNEKLANDLLGLLEDHEAMMEEDYRAGNPPRSIVRWDVTVNGQPHAIRMELA